MKVIQELHQYEEGLRPPAPSSAHTWEDDTWVLTEENAAELLRQEAERLCTKVDTAADSVRRALAGDSLRALEYQQAALEAQAFKDQGYPKKSRSTGRFCVGRQRAHSQAGGGPDPRQVRRIRSEPASASRTAPQGQGTDSHAHGQRQGGPCEPSR